MVGKESRFLVHFRSNYSQSFKPQNTKNRSKIHLVTSDYKDRFQKCKIEQTDYGYYIRTDNHPQHYWALDTNNRDVVFVAKKSHKDLSEERYHWHFEFYALVDGKYTIVQSLPFDDFSYNNTKNNPFYVSLICRVNNQSYRAIVVDNTLQVEPLILIDDSNKKIKNPPHLDNILCFNCVGSCLSKEQCAKAVLIPSGIVLGFGLCALISICLPPPPSMCSSEWNEWYSSFMKDWNY